MIRSHWVFVLVLIVLGSSASSASAATEPFGPRVCLTGAEAGRCQFIRGTGSSPASGNFYVADLGNRRINEFTAWGEFVKSWGWGVDTGAAALETCTAESACQQGLAGTGVGQFEDATGVAVDSEGNVYVTDPAASRVQKFSPDGEFLLMFGGGVNQGPNNPGNVCTAADVLGDDTCGAGTPGTGDGEFSPSWPAWSNIAIGPDDEVYVGDKGRIQEFDTDGNFGRVLPDPDEVLRNGTQSEDKAVGSLAVDPVSGDIYLAYVNSRQRFLPSDPGVFRLEESTGALLDTIEVERPVALATDASSNLYVFDQLRFSGSTIDPLNHGTRILKFDSSGTLIETIGETPIFSQDEIENSMGLAANSFCFGAGEAALYVGTGRDLMIPKDFVQAYGPTPDPAKCEPPDAPPEINSQFATSVGETSATLKAEINPRYFTPPVGETTYYVQWGTDECITVEGFGGGCAHVTPAPPGAALESPPANEDILTDPVVLEGLAPLTTYRYRFVAERERAAGAEPPTWIVIGVGGEPGTPGADAAFTTLQDKTIDPCPNDAFREDAGGAGMHLRDCRAYELVSPVNKGGGDVETRLNIVPYDSRMDQASVSGEELTFSAYRAFADPKSAPFSSQYLTRRTSGGWQTEAISPPQEDAAFISPLLAVDNLYRAFSPDLSQSWLYTYTEPVLGTGGLAGFPNVYRRGSATGTYENCTTAVPISKMTDHTYQLQGFSESGDLAAFRIEAKLTPNGSDEVKTGDRPINQAYVCAFDDAGNATVRLVSVLPNGQASDLENTIGGPANEVFQGSQGRAESLDNAVSADGSKVFWTASSANDATDPGALYVRVNADQEETASGVCEETEPDKACTVLISPGATRFWKAADDGSIALLTNGSDTLSEYEVATGETRPIAEEVLGLLGASESVDRVWFLSEDEIGGEGEAGESNLYLYDRGAGEVTFIATLSERDGTVGNTRPSPGNFEPVFHAARVTPDGSAVAFMSDSAELAEEVAGYDNTDQSSGAPAAEIYRYKIGDELVCVSCNRTGQRPVGREIQNKNLQNNKPVYAASMLPPWLNALYAPRVISDNGNRVFFEAFESLSPADTNDKTDVYQWEALNEGNCTEGDSAFDPRTGGCLSLLSSGKSLNDSQFVDASPSGDDVFIRTASSLVSADPEATDIYDARVLGGFAPPPPPPDPNDGCSEEACQPAPREAPAAPTPATTAPSEGNVPAGKPRPRKCRKGTHRVKRNGKVRCVKNKNKKADKARRAGR